MNFKEIKELIKLVDQSNLTEFKLRDGEFNISLRTKDYEKSPKIITGQQPVVPIQSAVSPPVSAPPAAAPSAAAASNAEAAAEESGEYIEVKSPIVGTFYRSPAPDKAAYVKVGDSVQPGSVVCIIEAMKLFNEIEAEISGTIVKVLVEDATPVEYDQVLFLVEPN
jgi:acetyl-CoA carboxylase biotin carboxyl carrier protein